MDEFDDQYPIRRLQGQHLPSRYVWDRLRAWCSTRDTSGDVTEPLFFRIVAYLDREGLWGWAIDNGWAAADDAAAKDAKVRAEYEAHKRGEL